LSIKSTSTSTTNISVCANQLPYIWNGISYNAAGTYNKTLVNAAGCDSIATLNLTVKSTSTSTTNVSVCANQLPYVWNSISYNTAGTYNKTLVNAAGCDSVATLILVIKTNSLSTTNITICSSHLPFVWNGLTCNAAGTYEKVLINSLGCDSIARLNITVVYTTTSTTNVSFCANQLPYLWNGTSYNASGTYYKTLVNAAGCDSIATLNLSVKATSTSTTNISVCSNHLPYAWNGTSYNAAGTYTKTLVNVAGCDSIATLNLSVKATSTSTTNISVCANQLPIVWNGTSYNAAGTYNKTLVNSAGCDSTATLILTVKSISTSNVFATACNSYSWHNQIYNQSGIYYFTTNNSLGCDSTVALHLTINNFNVNLFVTDTIGACGNSTLLTVSYGYSGYLWSNGGTGNQISVNTNGWYKCTVNNGLCSATDSVYVSLFNANILQGNTAICSGSSIILQASANGIVDIPQNLPENLTDGLVAYYPFNNNSNDVGPNHIDGNSFGALLSADRFGNMNRSYQFNGLSDYLDCGYNSQLELQDQLSFSGWLYMDGGVQDPVGFQFGNDLVNSYGFSSVANSSNNRDVTCHFGENSMMLNLSNKQWHNVIFVCDRTNNIVKLYSNGQIAGSMPYVGSNPLDYLNSKLFIGKRPFANDFWGGKLDDIMIWNRPLTYEEVQQVYNFNTLSYLWSNGATTSSIEITPEQSDLYYVQVSNGINTCSDTVSIQVNQPTSSVLSAIACNSYVWNGVNYTQSGTYSYTTTNANGCDSLAILNLVIIPGINSDIYINHCGTYKWPVNGQNYSQSGNYVYTSGCDVTTLHLTILQSTTSTSVAVACGSYNWHGQTYTQSGIYTYTEVNASGCDSVMILNLTVKLNSITTLNIAACNSYVWNGQTYNQSGNYSYTGANSVGCDSIVYLNLTIKRSTIVNQSVTACNSYVWNGQTYNQTGTYSYSGTNSVGCDSTVYLNLIIKRSTVVNQSVTVCNSYQWNGQTYNQTGTYSYIGANSVGCDSIVYLNLTVKRSTIVNQNVSACNTYTWNGQTYNQSGTYSYTGTNSVGCDSIVYLNLTVKRSTIVNQNVIACNSYVWNGQAYNQSGSYSYMGTNSVGCDSTVYLNLVIKRSTVVNQSVTVCNSYQWNGQTYNQTGTYTYIGTNSVGCDSTVYLNLTIKRSTIINQNVTACNSYVWNGQTYNQSGSYSFIGTNSVGCDSIYILNLTISRSATITQNVTACNSYTWGGQTYTQTGSYSYYGVNVAGCDSIVFLNLTIRRSTTISQTVVSCNNYVWNGQTYNQTGTYSYSGTNAVGCDSILYLNLTIKRSTIISQNIITCNSYAWNGQTYNQSGTYSYSATNSVGCDSIVILNLTVKRSTNSVQNISSCGSYTWNGQVYAQSGTYSYTGVNSVGCDSIMILNLTIKQTSSSTQTIAACGSYIWNGQSYTQSGAYTYTTVNSSGCDSLAILSLTISNSSAPAQSVSASATTISAGNSVTLSVNGGVLGTAASWKWYSGSCGGTAVGTGTSITVTPSATTTYYLRAEGACNITSCAVVTITVNAVSCAPTGIVSNVAGNAICSGGSVTLTVQGTLGSGASWKWYKGACGSGTAIGTGASITVTQTSTTFYYVRSEGGACGTTACASISIATIAAPVAPASITGPTTGLCLNTNVNYTCAASSTATSYNWTVPTGATIVSGQGTTSVVVNFGSTITGNSICVTAINACGSRNSRCVTVLLAPSTPATAIISGPTTVTCNQQVTYSVAVISGATNYTWVLPTGWTILSGQGTTSISVKVGCSKGNVQVTPSNSCGNGNVIKLSVSIKTATSKGTEIPDQSLAGQINIWPIPAKNILYFNAVNFLPEKIEIYDATGKRVITSNWKQAMDVSRLSSGFYIVKIYSDKSVTTRKVEIIN
jgi:hypothetical protein